MSIITPEALCSKPFAYVIVVGGTAGLTLAARLTEDPKVSVAVIEAGKDFSDDLFVNAWGLTTGMLGNPDYDWDFWTIPQVGGRFQTLETKQSITVLNGNNSHNQGRRHPTIASWLGLEDASWAAQAL